MVLSMKGWSLPCVMGVACQLGYDEPQCPESPVEEREQRNILSELEEAFAAFIHSLPASQSDVNMSTARRDFADMIKLFNELIVC